jgi:hypothetical protein
MKKFQLGGKLVTGEHFCTFFFMPPPPTHQRPYFCRNFFRLRKAEHQKLLTSAITFSCDKIKKTKKKNNTLNGREEKLLFVSSTFKLFEKQSQENTLKLPQQLGSWVIIIFACSNCLVWIRL